MELEAPFAMVYQCKPVGQTGMVYILSSVSLLSALLVFLAKHTAFTRVYENGSTI